MPSSDVAHPRRLLGLLLSAVLALGIADSMTGSYIVLFGADRARMSPFEIGVFVSVTALSGIAASMWLGRRYDEGPSRAPALVAVAAPTIGYLLLVTTTSYPLLLVVAVVFLGVGAAAFPQLFALARSHLDARTSSARRVPAMRSAWSLAWAVGPLLGGFVLSQWGFGVLFVLAAAAFGLVALPVLALGPLPRDGTRGEPRAVTESSVAQAGGHRPARVPLVVLISFTLVNVAQFSGAVAMPLYVTQVVDRPAGDVGLLFSVCALVEVPVALALMSLPKRVVVEHVILVAIALFIAYFLLMASSSTMVVLVVAHVVRGAAIAGVGALGITYFQDLTPGRVGYGTTLFTNTGTMGSLVAGIMAGAVTQTMGSRVALVLCGVLGALAFVLFAVATRTRPGPDSPRDRVARRRAGGR